MSGWDQGLSEREARDIAERAARDEAYSVRDDLKDDIRRLRQDLDEERENRRAAVRELADAISELWEAVRVFKAGL